MPILQPGHNVWREAVALASGVIVDAADYFHTLYWEFRRARRSILISGWEFDSTVELLRGADAPPGAEVRFLRFLNGLCSRNPHLYVCILAWNFNLVLLAEREWLQRVYFHWMTHSHFHFRVDDSPIATGSHHQKFAVVDGRIAFLGGIDIRHACWDDRRHLVENGERLSRGRPHGPYHDVQAYVAGGEAPLALEQYFFQRWQRAGGTLPRLSPPVPGGGDREPRGALPLGPTTLALSRTQPRRVGPAVREVERLFADAIAAAERMIYIETQYFSSRSVCDALVERMHARREPRLDVVVVVNRRAEAVKEEIAVGLRQAENLERLRAVAAETGHALGCYYSLAAGSADREPVTTYIHTKAMIVDDRFLTVGSANLTNRSMGLDSELHASWEAAPGDAHLQERIRAIRVSLLAEHSGLSAEGSGPLEALDGLVSRLDAIAARPDTRLRVLEGPSAAQEALMDVVDPQALPFDPAGADESRSVGRSA
jgi:phosphatidylserine/phosphatidylglycerophosphate/cardiolipin synthase-like enzyme